MYGGSKITLKGTNYWLSNEPFVGTWVSWNGPQVQQELSKAHDLGINAVRIGISYDHHDTMTLIWGGRGKMVATTPRIKYVMTQFLQIAASYNMKVIFVLFDWYDPYKLGLYPDERTNLTYLEGIVGPFVNDDRVLAWDLSNEPEFSGSWEGGLQSNYILWLNDIAHMVKSIDKNHPVTVGVGNDNTLWLPAKNGTTILSFVDFVAFHCYDAGALAGQIAEIKAHTSKPIVLEEMGWPTGLGDEKPVPNAVYDEKTQNYLYTTMLATSKSANIGGVFQWTLWDYWGSMTAFVPGHERFFGLVRADGSFKPAAEIFKDNYVVPALPSQTSTHYALDTNDRPRPAP
jgi:endo-1,4-beta-mannosidase